jgi:hypothetical protein
MERSDSACKEFRVSRVEEGGPRRAKVQREV